MTKNYIEDPEWIYDWWHPYPEGYELLVYVHWTQWNAKRVRESNPDAWAKRPKYQHRCKHVLGEVEFTSINGNSVWVCGTFIPKELHDFCRFNAFPYLKGHYLPASWTEERLKGTPHKNRFIY